MSNSAREWEYVELDGREYVVTREGVGYLCEHVADLLDAGASEAGVACDMCGGASCEDCLQLCDECQQVLCPACKRVDSGICS